MKDPHSTKGSKAGRPASDSIPLLDLLEQADIYVLRNFLRNETKRNKQLTTRLKTRLIESASLPDFPNKYQTLVGEVIREDVHGVVKLPKREVKLLHETCSSLLKVAENQLIALAYTEVYLIVFGILVNLHRYLDKTHDDSEELADVLLKTYEKVQSLLRRDLAPELRDEIQIKALSLVDKSYHRLPDFKLNALSTMLLDQANEKRLELLTMIAEDRLSETGCNENWIAWYTILKDLNGQDPDAILIMQLLDPPVITRMADQLFSNGFNNAGYRWVRIFDGKVHVPRNQASKWKNWRFEANSQTGQQRQVLNTGVELVLETSDYTYLDRMKEVVAPEEIASALADEEAFEVLAGLYIRQKDWKGLRQVIDSSGDIGIITRNAAVVIKHIPKPEHFIRKQVHQFLTHRAGQNCSAELNRLIDALEDEGFNKMAIAVRDEIFTTYPGRFRETPEGLDISY